MLDMVKHYNFRKSYENLHPCVLNVQKDKLVPLNKSSTRQIVDYIISFAEVEKYQASQNAIFCTCLV